MWRTSRRTAVVATAIALVTATPAPAQPTHVQPVPVPPARGPVARAHPGLVGQARDTVRLRRTIQARLAEARTEALRIADVGERERLLGAILDAQLASHDLAGADTTARMVGHDRTSAFTRAMCGYVDAARFGDAEALARAIPVEEDRQWALAHLASQRARLAVGGSHAAALAAAAATARAVSAPLPRTDGLISVARWQLAAGDTAGAIATADTARATTTAIEDPELRMQRLALLAGHRAAAGQVDTALRMAAGLPELRDRWIAIMTIATAAPAAGHPGARAALATLARDSIRLTDPRARRYFVTSLDRSFAAQGDSVTARRLEQAGRTFDDVSPSLVDSAEARAMASDYAGAIALVERLPDPRGTGRKARAYLRISRAVYPENGRDSALMLLRRGRAAALAEAGPEVRDEVLGDLAQLQFWLADNEGALETTRHITNAADVISAANDLATSTLNRADYAEQRRIAMALPQAEARAAVLAQVIERHVRGDRSHGALDLAVERARADSIPIPRYRVRALAAVAEGLLARGDTTAARTIWRSLLADPEASARYNPTRVVAQLTTIDDTTAIEAWIAGQGTAAARVGALLAYSDALRIRLARATGRGVLIRLGPDPCTDLF